MLIHASCVSIGGKGVLIAGSPGSGKSDLALRLIDTGAALVADDQTLLSIENDMLTASAPPSIKGLIEARHIGLLSLPYSYKTPVTLYVDLANKDSELQRLPQSETFKLLDCPVQRLRLHSFEASTPAKIRAALLYPLVSDRA